VDRVARGATGPGIGRDRLDASERRIERVAALIDERRLSEHPRELNMICSARAG
jgi:hypothetical protein